MNGLLRAGVAHAGPCEARAWQEVGREEEQGVQGIRERIARAPEPLRQASAPTLPRDEIEGYLAKGERMLKAGDIAAARLFFSRAAEAGEVRGALAMARSFDQETLRTLPVYGLQPNPQEAARWYAKAKDLGPTAAR